MVQHFDPIAAEYDRSFTHTEIGKRQRAAVHVKLEQLLSAYYIKNVLELNCGTGEDAVFLAQKGLQVLATDISPAMVQMAAAKAERSGMSQFIRTKVCAFQDIGQLMSEPKFDLIFSDFGGLNCLPPDDFATFVKDAALLLSPGGLFVAVVMPRFCLWETAYFLLKGKLGQAFRRLRRKPISARLDDGSSVDTWYYSPADLQSYFNQWQRQDCRPIGLFIPPSYLEPFFARKTTTLDRLANIDQAFARRGLFSGFADHFMVVFRKGEGESEV